MLKNTRVLVTGGAGFIGSHIATRLAEANEIIIYDIFTTGRPENIAQLKDKPNVEVLRVDIRDKAAVAEHMAGVDYIFHLAALVSVPKSIAEPRETNENNITGTLNILQAARENNVKKVIFSSSAAVYGDEPTLPKVESMPTLPKSPYAVSKIAGENLCQVYNEHYGLPTAALRYFNVFGPRQDPCSEYAAVVPKFIERIRNNQPPIIYGDGNQTRDLIYIDDVVEANLQAALSENANGQIINIARGEPITVESLAKTLIDLSNTSQKPEHLPERPGDIKYSYADISKARKLLNWQPKISIQDGLKFTYKFYNCHC